MTKIKLEFPEPYKHDHPLVCDGSLLFEEQLTFSQKTADWVAETVGYGNSFSLAECHIWYLDVAEYYWLVLPLGPLSIYFDELGYIYNDFLCCLYYLD